MDSQIIYVLSNCFRFILITATTHTVSIIVQSAMLERKHNLKYLILYCSVKIVFINTILGVVLKELYNDVYQRNEWLQILYTVCTLTAAVVTYWIFYYTFQGEFIRIAVVAWIGELVSSFLGYFSIGTINALEKREFFAHFETFRILDFGIPILNFALLAILYYFSRPLLKKMREHEIRHKKLVWTLFVSYVVIVTVINLWTHRVGARTALFMTMFTVAGIFLILLLVSKQYKRELMQEQLFLETQQNWMKSHYQNILEEMKRIELERKETERQMWAITALKDKALKQIEIFRYRQSLIQEYEKLKAGMYCDDWMLDAVLCRQDELLASKGISLECSMQEYRNKTISRQDILQLILTLIHWSIRANEKLENNRQKWAWLQMSSVKNQLILQFKSSWDEKERISKNVIKRYNPKVESEIQIEKQNDYVRVTVVL